MAEKKNLVIKVKIPATTQSGNTAETKANVITVWNFQRIALAGIGLLAIILVPLTLMLIGGGESSEVPAPIQQPSVVQALPASVENRAVADQPLVQANQPSVPSVTAANPIQVNQVAKTYAPTASKSKETSRVRRAYLTAHVIAKEPANPIPKVLTLKPGKPVTIYYFTEVRGMNGKTLFHEWLRDGIPVTKEPLVVGADRWRMTTHRNLDAQASGNWTVRLTDDHGMLLNESYFEARLTE